MSNKKSKPKHPPNQKSPVPDPEPDEQGRTYVIGKVRIPSVVSKTIDGYMTAVQLKRIWDCAVRVKVIYPGLEEYIEDDDDEDYED